MDDKIISIFTEISAREYEMKFRSVNIDRGGEVDFIFEMSSK